MKFSITKGIAGIAIAGASFVGGMNVDNAQIDTLQMEKNEAVESKQNVVYLYVYSQVSSGRIPTIDSSISLESVQEAYKRMTDGSVSLSDTDLFEVGKRVAKEKGDYVCDK